MNVFLWFVSMMYWINCTPCCYYLFTDSDTFPIDCDFVDDFCSFKQSRNSGITWNSSQSGIYIESESAAYSTLQGGLLPRNSLLCLTFTYTQNGDALDSTLSVYLGDTKEIWRQKYRISPGHIFSSYKTEEVQVVVDTSVLDEPFLKIEGTFTASLQSSTYNTKPKMTIYSLTMDVYNVTTPCVTGVQMPFTCYFSHTWCGFVQRIDENADWMIIDSHENGLIQSDYVHIPHVDCPGFDIGVYDAPVVADCKGYCTNMADCVGFVMANNNVCYLKPICVSKVPHEGVDYYQLKDFFIRPMFTSDTSAQTATLDLQLGVTGTACLSITYIAYRGGEDTDARIDVSLLDRYNNVYSIILEQAGASSDEKYCTYTLLAGVYYTNLTVSVTCDRDCTQSALIGLREVLLTETTCACQTGCSNFPCVNGGSCISVACSSHCECTLPYSGTRCQEYALPVHCSFGDTCYFHQPAGSLPWLSNGYTFSYGQKSYNGDYIYIDSITGGTGTLYEFPLPEQTSLCISMKYSLNGAGIDKLAVQLYDRSTGESYELWKQRYTISQTHDFYWARQELTRVAVNTSIVSSAPALQIRGVQSAATEDDIPAIIIYDMLIEQLNKSDPCYTGIQTVPYSCHFDSTWCGFVQSLTDDSDWMIVNSDFNSAIRDRYNVLVDVDCPMYDMSHIESTSVNFLQKCKDTCSADKVCVGFALAFIENWQRCYLKGACSRFSDNPLVYTYLRIGYMIVPKFEELAGVNVVTQTAALDLYLHNLTGEACLNITYIAYGPETLQLIIEIYADNGDNFTVLNSRAGDNIDEQFVTFDLLYGVFYTGLKVVATCSALCHENTTLTGIRQIVINEGECPCGEELIPYCMTGVSRNGSCYWTIEEELDFNTALKKCQERQGHLAIITSEEEQEFIYDNLHLDTRKYWIGLESKVSENFAWIDGSPLNWTNVMTGSILPTSHRCVSWQLADAAHLWTVKLCSYSYLYAICEQQPNLPDTVIIDNAPCESEIYVGKWCYWFDDPPATYDLSRVSCKQGGGDLASIKTAQEHLFVTSQLTDVMPYWIGLRDFTSPNNSYLLLWADGDPVTWSQWPTGLPADAAEFCVRMEVDSAGKYWMKDRLCDFEYRPLCKRAVSSECIELLQTTTVEHTTTQEETTVAMTTTQEETTVAMTTTQEETTVAMTTGNSSTSEADTTVPVYIAIPEDSITTSVEEAAVGTATTCGFLDISRPLLRDREDHTVGTVVVYWCEGFYQLQGGVVHRSLVCMDNGHWSSALPTCADRLPEESISQSIQVTKDTTASSYQLYCLNGETLNHGLNELTLPISDKLYLLKQDLQCKTRCPALPFLAHAHVTFVVGHFLERLSVVKVTCSQGYRFPHGQTDLNITCLDSGTWSQSDLQPCLIITCPAAPRPVHTDLSTDLAVYGTVVRYTCSQGFHFLDWSEYYDILCQDNSEWHNITEIPQCTRVDCGKPHTLPGAHFSHPDTTYFDSQVLYTCETSGRFNDGHTHWLSVCTDSAVWNVTDGNCTATRCPPLEVGKQTLINTRRTDVGTSVNVTCEAGYVFEDASTYIESKCLEDNIWSKSIPQCSVGACEAINITDHMGVNSTVRRVGSYVEVRCEEGFVMFNNSHTVTVMCTLHFTWYTDMTGVYCTAVICPLLNLSRRAVSDTSGGQYGDTVTVLCQKGHWFMRGVSAITLTCQADGAWDKDLPECKALSCDVPSWHNLRVLRSGLGEAYTMGDGLNYTCREGFSTGQHFSFKLSTCNASGQWEPPLMACENISMVTMLQSQSEPVESLNAWLVGGAPLMAASLVLLVIIFVDLVTFSRYFTLIISRYKNAWHVVSTGTVIGTNRSPTTKHSVMGEVMTQRDRGQFKDSIDMDGQTDSDNTGDTPLSDLPKRPQCLYRY